MVSGHREEASSGPPQSQASSFLCIRPPSMASLPRLTTSPPGMQALPESCGRAGLASEAIIKLQSSVTPLSKHVRQEWRCGSSSTQWLEMDISDGALEQNELAWRRALLTYTALQQTPVIMCCRDCEVSAAPQEGCFIYLSYYLKFFFFFCKWTMWVCQGTRGMVCKHGAREDGQPNLAQDVPQNILQRCKRPLTLVIIFFSFMFRFLAAFWYFYVSWTRQASRYSCLYAQHKENARLRGI